MEEHLLQKLERYAQSDCYPLHMPGHKRRISHFEQPFSIDITEIDGFDNLHHAQGVLREAQRRAAALYGAEETYYLVNGSTCGILAAVAAAAPRGSRILMARGSHKAAYHAVLLGGLQASWLYPRCALSCGVAGGVCAEDVRAALREHPETRAVLITSPTYDGVVSDVRAIAEEAHAAGAVLIVDEAHGAHFGMHPYFPERALAGGADLVVNSLHKTLPSLTQTALLHVQGGLADRERLRRYLGIFQTSSPSYVLMAGMDACVDLLTERGAELFDTFVKRLRAMRERLRAMRTLRLVEALPEELLPGRRNAERQADGQTGGRQMDELDRKLPGKRSDSPDEKRAGSFCYDYDRSKVLISTEYSALNGPELAGILRGRYHLEPEMAAPQYVTLILTVADTQEGFDRLERALLEIDGSCGRAGALSAGPDDICTGTGTLPKEPNGICTGTGTLSEKPDGTFTETGTLSEELDGICTETGTLSEEAKVTFTETGMLSEEPDGIVTGSGALSEKSDVFFIRKESVQAETVMTIAEADDRPREAVPLEESAGRVSAEFAYLYPPGIPLVVPGERIPERFGERLRGYQAMGLELQGLADYSAETIYVIRQE